MLLFGAVQATMIMAGLWTVGWGAARRHQTLGLLMAIAGLIVILLPGLTAPPLGSVSVMLGSGVAGLEGRFLINIFIQGDIL